MIDKASVVRLYNSAKQKTGDLVLEYLSDAVQEAAAGGDEFIRFNANTVGEDERTKDVQWALITSHNAASNREYVLSVLREEGYDVAVVEEANDKFIINIRWIGGEATKKFESNDGKV